MERMRVSKIFSFEASHLLPDYAGLCANLHGHHWEVELTVEGTIDKTTGMVLDFALLKKIVEPWIAKLDHHHLNEILVQPTAENVAQWFVDCWESKPRPIALVRVRVWENADSCAEWRKE